ncbi:hypothetical protein BGZ76_011269 [Entomortierella beljakovae]|nr:hypothetical protein BGZ76_011269 [Entomortierella beljakovae]
MQKKPYTRSNRLALLVFFTLSVLSNSSLSLPTSRGHFYRAVRADASSVNFKRDEPAVAPTGPDAANIIHPLAHTPYVNQNPAVNEGFKTESPTKRDLSRRGLIPPFDYNRNSHGLGVDVNDLDSDENSFIYDKYDKEDEFQGNAGLRDYRVEAEDLDFDIDEDGMIEPLFYYQDLFDNDSDEDGFGTGEGILDEENEDDQDGDDDYRSWYDDKRQSRKGLGLTVTVDTEDISSADDGIFGNQHSKLWIADDWEEDMEGSEEMMDELMDWVEDLEHDYTHPRHLTKDQRDDTDSSQHSSSKESNLLVSNSWPF